MFIDAVLPAASELVMVYGGALAAGAFANQQVTLFGRTVEEGWPAYLAIALAGTIGYTLGSIDGLGDRLLRWPPVPRAARSLAAPEPGEARQGRALVRALGGAGPCSSGRLTPVIRSFVSVPAGVFEAPFVRYTLLTLLGSAIWCFAFAGAGYAAGEAWEDFHHAFRYVEYVVAAVDPRRRGLARLEVPQAAQAARWPRSRPAPDEPGIATSPELHSPA